MTAAPYVGSCRGSPEGQGMWCDPPGMACHKARLDSPTSTRWQASLRAGVSSLPRIGAPQVCRGLKRTHRVTSRTRFLVGSPTSRARNEVSLPHLSPPAACGAVARHMIVADEDASASPACDIDIGSRRILDLAILTIRTVPPAAPVATPAGSHEGSSSHARDKLCQDPTSPAPSLDVATSLPSPQPPFPERH